MTAFGFSARGPLCAIDTRQTPVRQAAPRGLFQWVTVRKIFRCLQKSLKKRLRTFVGGAYGVEPKGHLSVPEGVGQALTETLCVSRNRLRAASTL